uniref:Nucleoporin NSP1-like C-terminal domain-containing protein n=1 Tax=Nora virus TaxID=3071212 RepID=A0A2S0S4M8_NORAV|nr:hypothetical protein [Drosophila melanogaster Nora virus]
MALKEEIFKQDTTLFNVLDENEVTEIKLIQSAVTDVQTQVDQQKLQLDGLAKVVDNNQSRNEEQFVNINTMLVTANTEIDKLKTTTASLTTDVDSLIIAVTEMSNSTQSGFDALNKRVNQLESVVTINTDKIASLGETLTTIEEKQEDIERSLESANDEIGELQELVDDNDSAITALTTRVTALEANKASPWILKGNNYRIKYYLTNGTVRTSTLYAFENVYYNTPAKVAPTSTWTFTTNITITSLVSAYPYDGVPVPKSVPMRFNGSYATGNNTFESIAGSSGVIYDIID